MIFKAVNETINSLLELTKSMNLGSFNSEHEDDGGSVLHHTPQK